MFIYSIFIYFRRPQVCQLNYCYELSTLNMVTLLSPLFNSHLRLMLFIKTEVAI